MSLLYSKIREQLKTGDLLAWRITKITSFFDFILILYQKILKANFSHVGVVIKLEDRLFVVEATPPVVRLYPLSMLDDFYFIPCNLDQRKKKIYINLLIKHLGKDYHLSDLGKGMMHIKSDDKSLYCSELGKAFYKEIGFITDEDAGLTPDRLVKAVCKVTGETPQFVNIDIGNL